MNLASLYDYIDQEINTKTGTAKITGAQHNAVLKEVVASLIEITGTGFGGDLAPDDDPGSQTSPIYFLASAIGTFTYCGGIEVTALPAFIIWNGSAWTLNQIGVPTEETTDNGLRGIASSGDAEPTNPQLGDWYVYLESTALEWASQSGIAKPGIVRLESITPSNNWVLTPFGDENTGGSITIDEAPTEDSENAVSSGGVYTELAKKVSRVAKALTIVSTVIDLDFENFTQLVANNILAIAANASFTYSNVPNEGECQFRFDVTNTIELTFPAFTYMQDFDDRWNDATNVLSLDDGKYEAVITVVEGEYSLKVSSKLIGS